MDNSKNYILMVILSLIASILGIIFLCWPLPQNRINHEDITVSSEANTKLPE